MRCREGEGGSADAASAAVAEAAAAPRSALMVSWRTEGSGDALNRPMVACVEGAFSLYLRGVNNPALAVGQAVFDRPFLLLPSPPSLSQRPMASPAPPVPGAPSASLATTTPAPPKEAAAPPFDARSDPEAPPPPPAGAATAAGPPPFKPYKRATRFNFIGCGILLGKMGVVGGGGERR